MVLQVAYSQLANSIFTACKQHSGFWVNKSVSENPQAWVKSLKFTIASLTLQRSKARKLRRSVSTRRGRRGSRQQLIPSRSLCRRRRYAFPPPPPPHTYLPRTSLPLSSFSITCGPNILHRLVPHVKLDLFSCWEFNPCQSRNT